VNVWLVLLSSKLIRSFVLDSNLTGGKYKFFLRHELPGLLECTVFIVSGQMYFHHDGAESPYTQHVKQYLQKCFLDHWLGHGGLLAWPPRSPDLTLLNYYLWGHMKTFVYEVTVDLRATLCRRVFAAAAEHRWNCHDYMASAT
jgi:hypothetical protein